MESSKSPDSVYNSKSNSVLKNETRENGSPANTSAVNNNNGDNDFDTFSDSENEEESADEYYWIKFWK